ncbi:MAG: TetR/AcrR family transcriptional regulator [Mycobacteriales bacterium]
MADGRTTRWAGHREQRRAAFVAAALAVLERHGPGVTVDQIAAELDVTRQALYRQFADRADLDRAIAAQAADELVAALLPAIDLTGDIPSSVRSALVAYLDHVQQHLPVYRFVRAHEADPGDLAVRRVKDTIGSRVAAIARDYLVSTGAAPAALAESFATGVVGMADAVIGRWLDDPGGLSRDEVVEHLVLMVTGTISAVVPAG